MKIFAILARMCIGLKASSSAHCVHCSQNSLGRNKRTAQNICSIIRRNQNLLRRTTVDIVDRATLRSHVRISSRSLRQTQQDTIHGGILGSVIRRFLCRAARWDVELFRS